MQVTFAPDDLRPVIEAVVRETLTALEMERAALGNALAVPEAKAAELLGIERHTLRDLRLAGKVSGSRLGKRIVYTRETLIQLLAASRTCGRPEDEGT